MQSVTLIELAKEDMKFSAGHYTIFSATEREKLHGHNFTVYAAFKALVDENGMAFDYDIYKVKCRALCKKLNSYFLIAENSPFQSIEEQGDYIYVHFHNEKIPFLKKDVLLLPLKNITVEELSKWFIESLTQNHEEIRNYGILSIEVKVFSGPGQSGSANWSL